MPVATPFARSPFAVALLGSTMLVSAARAQSADPGTDAALRSVVAAAYLRAGQGKTPAQLDSLVAADRPLVTFDPRAATEADILGLVGRLGLADASLPPPPAPVALTRTLSKAPLPAYAGAADLTGGSVTDLAGMLRRGETTSREIVLQYLYKIQAFDHAGPALRSVTQLNPDLLALADQMDARRADAKAKGETLPPLFGIPILVKNNIDTGDDLRTTASSLALIGSKPAGDAALIGQLRAQGALIMGKANMSEWANLRWNLVKVSPDGGVVLNPQDPVLTTSGSSSGSAVASAMRFAPLTLGTETNGSLMGPATTNHVWALKPTTGLVSRTGVIPGWATVDSPGPMANAVRDLAVAMNAMKALDPTDFESGTYTGDRSRDFTARLNGDLTGVRIGVNTSLPGAQALVQSLAAGSGATVTTFTRADEGTATKQAILALSDSDLGAFFSLIYRSPLPTDPAQRATAISGYRTQIQNVPSGSAYLDVFASTENSRAIYQKRKYIDAYLATRVSNPQDYAGAFVRLMGNLYTPNSTDPTQFAKNLNDVVTSDNLNNPVLFKAFPALSSPADLIAAAAAKTPLQFAQAAGFASTADYDVGIENWKRITSFLLADTRRRLGIDVAATDTTGTNFTFNTSAFASTPNLAVPIGPGTGPSQMILSAGTSQDELLLRVGYALDQALKTPSFASLRSTPPNPPPTGFSNQPADQGPLLPLVLNDLDDHDRASRAHLLTTEMAPLVLTSTKAATDTRFDGRISGNGGLIKDGAGTQRLTGASDFTGPVQVWRGTLALDRTEALGDLANAVTLEKGAGLFALQSLTLGRGLTLRDGGTLGVAGGQVLVQDGTVSGNGGLTKTGAGQLTLTADNAYTGGTLIAAGTLAVSREANLGQPYGAVTLADAATLSATASFVTARPFTLQGAAGLAVAADATLTASNVLSGPGTLTKLGAGTLTLTNANTYAGGTAIRAGTLQVGDGGTLGSIAGDVANAGILAFARADAIGFAGAISGSGGLVQRGPGTLTLTGANTYAGGTAIQAGTLQVGAGGTLGSIAGDVADAGTLVFNRSDAIGFAGAISGSGRLVQAGPGSLTLTGTSTYTGGTAIQAGTLQVGDGSTAGSIGGDVANAGSLVFARADAVGFAGAISGSGTLVQRGPGTLTLSGTSTAFTGLATVEAGTLALAGTFGDTAANRATLAVGAGATLRGDGTLAGSLRVDPGATVAVGGTTGGILAIAGDDTIAAGSTHVFTLGTPNRAGGTGNGSITVGGNLVIGGGTVELDSRPASGLYRLYTVAGTVTSAGAGNAGFDGVRVADGSAALYRLTAPGGASQINARVTLGGQIVQAWDGGDRTGLQPGAGGGAGPWQAGLGAWTDDPAAGTVNQAWQGQFGVFTARGGDVRLVGPQTVQGLQFAADGYRLVAAPGDGGALALAGDPVSGPSASLIRVDDGLTAEIAAPITGLGLNKAVGGGTLVLSGANAFAALAVIDGSVELRGGRALRDTAPLTLADRAGTGLIVTTSETIGSLSGGGGQGGSVAIGAGQSLITGADGTDTRFAGTITGAGALAKAGTGRFTLTGANAYVGGTAIQAGTLQIGDGGTAGSIAGDVANAGTLAFARSDAVGFAGAISGSGGLIQAGPGTLTLTGANTYTGGTAIQAGTLQVGDGGTLGSITGDVANAGILAFARSDAVSFGGAISGSGRLVQAGPGTLTLTGAGTQASGTTVAAGTLAVAPGARLAAPVRVLAGAGLIEAGTLAGGLDNAGATRTSGRIAGGLTNTGTLVASAGRLDGPVANRAGTVRIEGALEGDAGFDNAAGATLTVAGSYGLAGTLANAGTVVVAEEARLSAGAVANAGVFRVAARASVTDDLVNTGLLVNAGAYRADAVNAAGAILVNTGTFSTVSAPFANAGTLVTSGTLAGGLANAGAVQASGRIDGAVSNTGLIQLTGPTTGITRLTNDGALDLGATRLSVGSLAGSSATAVLANGGLVVGADGTSSTYAGRILDGAVATGLTKVGGGTLTLSGDSVFSGPLVLLGGGLAVTGRLGGATASLGAGTILTGQASLAGLAVGAGATLAPGEGGPGLMAVAGDLTMAPGARYTVDATADGRSDRLVVAGRASLAGGLVQAVAGAGTYAPRTRYLILSAAGGLDGRFEGVSANFAFLTPFLSYDAEAVALTLARNDLAFTAVAATRNQAAAAAAVQAGAVGSPLYDAVAPLSAAQARAAFAALAGDAYPSLASTAFATAGLLRETVLERLRRSDAASDRALPDASGDTTGGTGVQPLGSLDPRRVTLWGQGFGGTGRVATDGNAAGLARQTSGFLMGATLRLGEPGLRDGLRGEGFRGESLRIGVAGGYRSTGFASPADGQSGLLDGVFGGLYGAYEAGPLALRFGALAADDAVSLRRRVAWPGFGGNPGARTGGTTVQGFGELGYRLTLAAPDWTASDPAAPAGAGPVLAAATLEPFLGGAAVAIGRDRFLEQGGPAALSGAASGMIVPTLTAGLRGEAGLDLGQGPRLLAHALLGYRHAFSALTPSTRFTIPQTGASFVGAGLPIDRDALVTEAGLSLDLSPAVTLGVSYSGQIGPRAQDHTGRGSFTLRF